VHGLSLGPPWAERTSGGAGRTGECSTGDADL
jgi:hypothetical protein